MKKIISLILIIFSLINISSAQDSILNRSKLPKTVYMNEDFVDFRGKGDLHCCMLILYLQENHRAD